MITLGASLNLYDQKHRNTALHWAVYARNSNAVSLLLNAGANIHAVNAAGDTPAEMARKLNISWMIPRLNEADSEKKISSQSFFSRIFRDKTCRYWIMMATPFLIYYAMGATFDADLPILGKIVILMSVFISLILAAKYLFDDRLYSIIPLAIYLATKFWLYLTFVIFFFPGMYDLMYATQSSNHFR